MADLNEGDRAPDFDLPTDTGRVSLAGLKGRWVVLFFYPKDDTPGCTTEPKGFSEARDQFEALGLGGAAGGVVLRIEEQHHPAALQPGQRDAAGVGGQVEVGGAITLVEVSHLALHRPASPARASSCPPPA